MRIGVLGPLEVDGGPASLGPRDRVVLSALTLQLGRAVSAERLAEALWGDDPPASWNKVVPGCVLRLRRSLGAVAIETIRDGYRLTLPADDVDAHRFERQLQRGRELIRLGEFDRAAYVLGEALALWRGTALADVEHWEPGRIEADRLAALRTEAEEARLDAALRAGRHADVLGTATSMVAHAPLRERGWGLLARAQYQAGNQGEALRTLQRARSVLANELGLDPGPELAGLEQAILRQDPALMGRTAVADGGVDCPYQGLVRYDVGDAEAFFGRDEEVAACLRRLREGGVLAVVGPSGSGKSSLVRAGVLPAVRREGRPLAVMTPGPHPADTLARTRTRGTVLMVDQCEEALTVCRDPEERARFFAALVEHAARGPVVLTLRADRLGDLAAYPDVARLVERGLYLLGPMTPTSLRSVVEGPAHQAGLLLEPGLVDLLVTEVEGEPGALPLLSHALRRTWERREGSTLTVDGYRAIGGIRGCVAQSAERVYESLPDEQRPVLRQLLLRLVTVDVDGEPARTRAARRVLVVDAQRADMVETLVSARLLTADQDSVEIAHESLARAWPRLSAWLDEDVEGQRILRHLSGSADAWDAMGRPDSELYRGVRLSRALGWRAQAAPQLTPTESEFLDVGRFAAEDEERAVARAERQLTSSRRRARLLVAGVVALVVVTLVGALLVVRQRESAAAAADAADARRLVNAAQESVEADQSLLLAAAAARLDDTAQTRTALLGTLARNAALVGAARVEPVHSVAVSPDGSTVVVGGDRTTTFYASSFGSSTPALSTSMLSAGTSLPYRADRVEFRADGQQVALGSTPNAICNLGELSNQLPVLLSPPDGSSELRLGVPGVSDSDDPGREICPLDLDYSADGRRLAVGVVTGPYRGPEEHLAIVWELSTPDRPILLKPSREVWGIALSPDGTLLYVGEAGLGPAGPSGSANVLPMPSVSVQDVATGTVLRSIDLEELPAPASSDIETAAGLLELSADGGTLAVAQADQVVLYDAMLGEQRRLEGLDGIAGSLQFSADGRRLAAGSLTGEVAVWDVAGGQPERFTGHSGAVLGLSFGPDDALVSGGLDGQLLVWDLDGRGRWLAREPTGTSAILGGVAVPSPDGRAVVYAGSTAGTGETIRFLDTATSRLSEPVPDPGGTTTVAWQPRSLGRLATAAGDTVRVWDAAASAVVAERALPGTNLAALGWSADGARLVAADRSGLVRPLDAATLEPAGAEVSAGAEVAALAVAPDGRSAVAVLKDGAGALLEFDEGTVTRRLELGVSALVAAQSPDGDLLAVGSAGGEVGLLDLGAGEWVAPPVVAHRASVTGLSFAPDGATLISSGFDGTVALFEGRTGVESARVRPGRLDVPAVAALPAPNQAVVATRDGAVYRFDTSFDAWITAACAAAGRDLTPEQWGAVVGDRPYAPTCPTA